MTCIPKQRSRFDVTLTRWLLYARAAGFPMRERKDTHCRNGSEPRSQRTRDGSCDAERLAARKLNPRSAGVYLSVAMCVVKRAVTSVDDVATAGTSCARHIEKSQCEDKQRGGGCSENTKDRA